MTYDIVFVVASVVAIAAALLVVLSGNPFISSLALIGNLIALATFYILLQSDFLAAAQVIVYAGAVMIMFLFVTAYLGGRADAPWAGGPTWQQIGGVLAAGAILVEVIVVIGLKAGGKLSHEAKIESGFGSPHEIGRLFLTDHLLAFEITSVVLLVAAVGSVILGAHAHARGALVERGKEAGAGT